MNNRNIHEIPVMRYQVILVLKTFDQVLQIK